VTGYFAQLIPWMFVDRVVFIYHYFPATIFLILAIGYSIYILYCKNKKVKYYAFIYTILVVLMFLMFYPVLAGFPVEYEYVYKYLKWFKSWVLI
jgi:dolichyl-phosphate-mannose--protein O-mannosyl transferase